MIPSISGTCIRVDKPFSTCNRCQSVCPVHAVSLSSSGPDIDYSACTGCGFCVADCPETALGISSSPAIYRLDKDRAIATVACHPHRDEQHEALPTGHVTCIRALSLVSIIDTTLDGASELALCIGACGDCHYGGADIDVFEKFQQVSDYLVATGEDKLAFHQIDKSMLQAIDSESSSPQPERRSFLGTVVSKAYHHSTQVDKELRDEQMERHPLLERTALLKAKTGNSDVGFFTPVLDISCCTACGSCSRVCPHDAIEFPLVDEDPQVLSFTPANCTGCNACVDICDDNALNIQPNPASRSAYSLASFDCTRCGVTEYSIVSPDHQLSSEKTNLCRICRGRPENQDQKLFQVYSDL